MIDYRTEILVDITSDYSYILPEIYGVLNVSVNNVWVYNNCNKKLDNCRALTNLVRDTESMADQLDKPFSLSWDVTRMQRTHDKYVEDINLKKYSPTPFDILKDVPVKDMCYKDYQAVLLENAKGIHLEGVSMHHCVASYTGRCKEGSYLVFSITKDGVRSSTLGVNIHDGKYSFSQHYKHCNARVTDKDEIILAQEIIKGLNNG